ncbi:ATP-dependent endopeptidase hsl ATP-binding subunit [Staphylococcus aureus]|nr:ATP-dependent endopeptidase hsl ATP-binding subunit [Staphylococcus aureus]
MDTAGIRLTPKEIVSKLNEYIVGQNDAKRKVAIALRNRYRRSLLDEESKQEISPKNILMIGPTGVGKTEIARRMAKVVGAPFIKVEATKFTEVGYVGRDVESMVRDLVDVSVRLVKAQKKSLVQDEATAKANEKLVKLLVPSMKKKASQTNNPLESLFGGAIPNFGQNNEDEEEPPTEEIKTKRSEIKRQLEEGKLEKEKVRIKVEQDPGALGMLGTNQNQQMQEMMNQLMPKKKVEREVAVETARKILADSYADELIDQESANQEALELAEQMGIIFIDEIDKVATNNHNSGQDVSRQGVQRDILPILEGSVIQTKYGTVNTEHMLFIGAGAFHVSKPSDLIPELQGRFPIRVELDSLAVEDFVRILTEPNFGQNNEDEEEPPTEEIKTKRSEIKRQLEEGKLEKEKVRIKVEQDPGALGMLGTNQNQQMQEMMNQLMPKKKVEREVAVETARKILADSYADELIDQESANQEALELAEQMGIIFIDEIDKVATNNHNSGQDVSRQGVQRDILPILEGSVIQTKYGTVNTEHMLFIGAGAFHVSKPSDLIPELQGRFPIRVELDSLAVEDFVRILTEPKLSLIKQYEALLQTEEVTVNFTDEAITRLAEIAYQVNQDTDNIGARRLHTILEKMLEDLSFEAPSMPNAVVDITPQYVDDKLKSISTNKDLSAFIL